MAAENMDEYAALSPERILDDAELNHLGWVALDVSPEAVAKAAEERDRKLAEFQEIADEGQKKAKLPRPGKLGDPDLWLFN